MKRLLTLVFSCLSFLTFGQEISRSAHNAAGGSSKNNAGYTLEWTLGAQFSQVVQEAHHLTEGFQQGTFQKTPLSLDKETPPTPVEARQDNNREASLVSSFSLFPNPTNDQLFLRIQQDHSQAITLVIFDQIGKKILTQKIDQSAGSVFLVNGVETLIPCHYFIQIITPNVSSQVLSFIKN